MFDQKSPYLQKLRHFWMRTKWNQPVEIEMECPVLYSMKSLGQFDVGEAASFSQVYPASFPQYL